MPMNRRLDDFGFCFCLKTRMKAATHLGTCRRCAWAADDHLRRQILQLQLLGVSWERVQMMTLVRLESIRVRVASHLRILRPYLR